MLRNALAVLGGFLAWTVLFLSLAAALRALFPEAHGADSSVFATVPLLLYLVAAVLASLLAGYTAARIAASQRTRVALATGLVLLAVGLVVQIASWSLAPAWYNVGFLLVLAPLAILGGRLAGAPR